MDKGKLKSYSDSYLAIKNANESSDGSGAQFQRILSIYAFSRSIRSTFIFSKIKKIEIQHGDSFKSSAELEDFIFNLNQEITKIVERENVNLRFIEGCPFTQFEIRSNFFSLIFVIPMIKLFVSLFRKPVLIVLTDAYKFTNFFKRSYTFMSELVPPLKQQDATVVNLQVHVRMSTLLPKSDRFISPNFYINWIALIKSICESHGLRLEVGIHTDCDVSKINHSLIDKNVSSSTLSYWKAIGILTENGDFNDDVLTNYNHLVSEIRKQVSALSFYLDLNPIKAWDLMRSSTILLISRSSFSYVGALLATSSIILGPRMSTGGQASWIISDYLRFMVRRKFKKQFKLKLNI